MPFTVVLHVQNSEPVLGEVEELPTPSDKLIIVKNPRQKDGKDLQYLAEHVITVIWPVDRLSYIEVLPGEEDEEIFGFVRE